MSEQTSKANESQSPVKVLGRAVAYGVWTVALLCLIWFAVYIGKQIIELL